MKTMKHFTTILSCFICIQLFACNNKTNEMTSNSTMSSSSDNNSSSANSINTDTMELKVTIGTNTFIATLNNNETVTAFKAKLPLTINMRDLNGNEKYFDLPDNLPVSSSNPGTI